MSLTQRSLQLKSSEQSSMQGSKEMSQRSKRKGISLSKQHEKTSRGKSPSFIKVIQKNNKPVMVERRQIKLILKIKENQPTIQSSIDKQNQQNIGNIDKKPEKAHMDVLSTEGSSIIKTKEFGKFPLKKPVRKQRREMKNACSPIQLF